MLRNKVTDQGKLKIKITTAKYFSTPLHNENKNFIERGETRDLSGIGFLSPLIIW